MALSTVFLSINFPDNSLLSHCSYGLISALLVLSIIYLFMKASLSPDIILCGWLGLKHQLTNYLSLTHTQELQFTCTFSEFLMYSENTQMRISCRRKRDLKSWRYSPELPIKYRPACWCQEKIAHIHKRHSQIYLALVLRMLHVSDNVKLLTFFFNLFFYFVSVFKGNALTCMCAYC